jgi:hypothetical protein
MRHQLVLRCIMRYCGVRCSMRAAAMCCSSVRSTVGSSATRTRPIGGRFSVGSASIGSTCYRCAACCAPTICAPTIGRDTVKSTGIPSSATIAEAMAAPPVAIAPSRPWTHAQKDAVVKIARPVKPDGRAGIRSVIVVSVRTDGWCAYVDGNLRVSRWQKGQGREQRCRTE